MPRRITVSDHQYYGLLDLVEAELRQLSLWEKKTSGTKNASVKKELAYFRRLRTRLLNKQELVK